MPFEFWKSVKKFSCCEPKTCFRRSLSIFLAKPEVDFKNQRWCALFCTKLELLAFKFWKSVHWFSSYVDSTLWQTDIQTYIQTYRHIEIFISKFVHNSRKYFAKVILRLEILSSQNKLFIQCHYFMILILFGLCHLSAELLHGGRWAKVEDTVTSAQGRARRSTMVQRQHTDYTATAWVYFSEHGIPK